MGDIERLVAEADDGTVDAEFLQHLTRGGELLAAGRLDEARAELEKAFQQQPKNEKAQNLLGLTYFKLNIFDRAAEVYELLVRENPVDATLRVNLGLTYLKANSLQRAIREFEAAADLAPEHKKAQNYLGLAYAQAGEYARAKDCFVAAGSLTMAEKMERALRDPSKAPKLSEMKAAEPAPPPAPPAPVAPPPAVAPPAVAPPPPAPAAPPAGTASKLREKIKAAQKEEDVELRFHGEDEAPPAPAATEEISASDWAEGADSPAEAPAPAPSPPPKSQRGAPPAPIAEAAPPLVTISAPAAPAPTPIPLAAPVPPAPCGVGLLADLTRDLALQPPQNGAAFEVVGGIARVRVHGEVFTRLEGLLAASGAVSYVAEMKRFRGKATDKPFGEGEGRVVRVGGSGMLAFSNRGQVFVAVELGEESAYFREDQVFAFEEAIVYENGRVPSKIAPDLHLVHLRGNGKVLLRVSAPLQSVPIGPGVPCVVPLSTLVGWHGQLTPRVVALPDEQTPPVMPALELSGEGFAILTGIKPI